VDDREHIDSLSHDSVDDAVAPIKYFSDILDFCLRYDAAIIGKVVSRSARVIKGYLKIATACSHYAQRSPRNERLKRSLESRPVRANASPTIRLGGGMG
jgi:hypothetical protein